MRIAIDLRSLSSGNISGVENYSLNLIERLLAIDKKNIYTLFYNAAKFPNILNLHYINSTFKITRIPNKILNFAFKFKLISINKLIGDFDLLFLPNLNQFFINPHSKLVITVHDLSFITTSENYDLKRKLWHKFLNYGKALNRADLILAVSDYTKNDLVRIFNLPEKKIKVIYPGVDFKIFNPNINIEKLRQVRNKYSLPGDYFLFLNTIEPRKNLTNLIKAFELLDSSISLVISGRKGWKYRHIFKTIKKSSKANRIKYLGYVAEIDKPALIKMSKALVYPSLYEGFGFQPLEAMAMGVPTIVSEAAALPEINQGASLLVNPFNTINLVNALREISVDENLRQSLVEKGYNRSKVFEWQNCASQTLQAINSMEASPSFNF